MLTACKFNENLLKVREREREREREWEGKQKCEEIECVHVAVEFIAHGCE